MSESLILSREELVELTQFKRFDAQCRWLESSGFIIKKRRDGSPVLSRRHFLTIMNPEAQKMIKKIEPNWAALDADHVTQTSQ